MKNFITKSKKYWAYFLSIFCIVLVWAVFAKIINAELILPKPKNVFLEIIKKIQTLSFWKNFSSTFLRIVISYFITVFLGVILGYFCGTYKFFRDFLEIPVGILRTTPVIAVILIALFWFSSNSVPVFVCVLMTLPIMITNVTEGFKITNEKNKLQEMGRVFHFTKFQNFVYIRLPQAAANIKSGLISTFGLCWKVVVAGEVLCIPSFAVGSELHKAQIHLETSTVLAETIILVVICFTLEKLIEKLIFVSSVKKGDKNE